MSLPFRLTAKARDDMKSIGQYTEKTWGREQRNVYLTQLDQAFHIISADPGKGQACDSVRPGYFRFRCGRHVIFYRIANASCVEVVRILHRRMDFGQHV